MSKHFRSDKYKSLVRQLNIHGFKKNRSSEKINYSHLMFIKGNRDDLKYIRRVAVKNEDKNKDDKAIENTEDYDTLKNRLSQFKKDYEEKCAKIKKINDERKNSKKNFESRFNGKETRVLKLLHLLFKSRGKFSKSQLRNIGKKFPTLEAVLTNLSGKKDIKAEIFSVMDGIGDLDAFADSVYSLFNSEVKAESVFNTPFKKDPQIEKLRAIVPNFGISPIKSSFNVEAKKEEKQRENESHVEWSIFKTPIKRVEEEEREKGKDPVLEVKEFSI